MNLSQLASEITRRCRSARTEEDVKLAIEPLIREYLETQLGISITPTYEVRTGVAGRRDAVYGHFTLEYKRPGYLKSPSNQNEAMAKLIEYLTAQHDDEQALMRVAGACTDGQQIFFVRYWPQALVEAQQYMQMSLFSLKDVPGGFQKIGPRPLDEHSLEELFRYLGALSRRPLIAETLAETFGPSTEVAQRAVQAFYRAIQSSTSERVRVLYNQWQQSFGIVYGEKNEAANRHVPDLAAQYGLKRSTPLRPLLFSIHTYFALLMKMIAVEVLSLQERSLTPSILREVLGLSGEDLRRRLSELESGDQFAKFGIRNFLEGDFFSWYLDEWNEDMSEAIQGMIGTLIEFEPATPSLRPGETRDLLKKLYQYLIPKSLRRALGEYYTPDWLAEYVLDKISYHGDPDVRLLDPACGSGTFLTIAISRVRQMMAYKMWDWDADKRKECAEKILRNIVGFDLNPLAVIAARTNYLLAFGDLLRDKRPITIPVFNCDSVLTPVLHREAQVSQTDVWGTFTDHFFLPTVVGTFKIPKEVLDKRSLDEVTTVMEECVADQYNAHEFRERLRERLRRQGLTLSEDAEKMIYGEYEKLLDLEQKGRNGIWARLLKNSFAPILQEPFDVIVGNPPWVNWDRVSSSWRSMLAPLLEQYGLFTLTGLDTIHGGGKKDIAMAFTYVCADHYLRDGGRLCFVVTQTVFKSQDAGQGFRRFQIGSDGTQLRVESVDDFVAINPFDDATNRTAVLLLEKGQPTTYPVPYVVWSRQGRQRISFDATLRQAEKHMRKTTLSARPVTMEDVRSPWITVPRPLLGIVDRVVGVSDYEAHAGCVTWLNGVFYVRVLEVRPDGYFVIENVPEEGRQEDVPVVREVIEPDLVYPLLRGRHIRRWEAVPDPGLYILFTQDPERRVGWPEEKMRRVWPYTYRYLKRFEDALRARPTFQQHYNPNRDPFWTIYGVGPYTMAPYKVCWREQANDFVCGLAGMASAPDESLKVVIPNNKVIFVGLEDRNEALYLMGVLNSTVVKWIVRGYTINTSISTHVLEYVRVPKFNANDALHQAIAEVVSRDPVPQAELDMLVGKLWDLTEREIWELQRY